MRPRYLLLLLVFCNAFSFAQTDKVVLRFLDAERNVPLKNVSVIDPAGLRVAVTDTSGYMVLSLSLFGQHTYLLALCPGYRPDTLSAAAGTVYMVPLSMSLKETTVRSSRVSRLLNFPNEYVVDYAFSGDSIIAATYSGNSGNRARLFLLNRNGVVLADRKLPAEPLSLYESCIGHHYCVCTDKFYRIDLQDSLQLVKDYGIALLPRLQECECSRDGNFYYRFTDKTNFHTQYGMVAKGDSTFRLIADFEKSDVAIQSYIEWIEIQMLLTSLKKRKDAVRKQFARLKWDKGTLTNISFPMYACHDTLVIFDFFQKKLLLFGLAGDSIGCVPMHFELKEAQQFRILKDETREALYIHRYDNQGAQTMERIDIASGTISRKVPVEQPFAEDVKVHDGNIYYLWQDQHAHATRQLFIQYLD